MKRAILGHFEFYFYGTSPILHFRYGLHKENMWKNICRKMFQLVFNAVYSKQLLYVQEVVTHLYSNLQYKMGHYFLDTQ